MKKTALLLIAVIIMLFIPVTDAMAGLSQYSIKNAGREVIISIRDSSWLNKPVVLRIGKCGKSTADIKEESLAMETGTAITDFSTVLHLCTANTDASGKAVFKVLMPEDAPEGKYPVTVFINGTGNTTTFNYDPGKYSYIPVYEKIIHYGFEETESFTGRKNITLTDNKYFSSLPSISAYKSSMINAEATAKYKRDNNGNLFYSDSGTENELSYTIFSLNHCTDATFSDEALKFRSSNLAFSFKAAISSNVKLKINAYGLPTTVNLSQGVPQTGYYKTYVFETDETSNTAISYNAVKNNSAYSGYTIINNAIKRETLQQYTFIYRYASNTYSLYIDNELVLQNRTMAGSLRPASFQVTALLNGDAAASDDSLASVYLDDLELYTLSNEDVDAQYNLSRTEGGTLSLDVPVMKKGENLTLKIVPDKGYEAKSFAVAGAVYPCSSDGGEYEITSAPLSNAVISAEFVRIKTRKKNFEIKFNEFDDNPVFLKGDRFEKDLLKYEAENISVASIITTEDAVASIENGKLKFNIPEGSLAKIRLLGEMGNETKNYTDGPFAIAFTGKISSAIKMTLTAVNNGTTTKLFEYDFSDKTHKNATEGIRTYKIITDPDNNGKFYADGNVISEYTSLHLEKNAKNIILTFEGINDSSAVIENISFYSLSVKDTKSQPEVIQSGKGRIRFDKDIYSSGEEAIITVIPPTGGYIKNVYINGLPVPAFGREEINLTIDELSEKDVIQAEFDTLTDEPCIVTSPLMLRDDVGTYVFMKIVSGKEKIDIAGIQISVNDPDFKEENVKTVPFDSALTTNEKGISAKGYYGYRIIREDKNAPFYIRPYASANDITYTGDSVYVEPEKIPFAK